VLTYGLPDDITPRVRKHVVKRTVYRMCVYFSPHEKVVRWVEFCIVHGAYNIKSLLYLGKISMQNFVSVLNEPRDENLWWSGTLLHMIYLWTVHDVEWSGAQSGCFREGKCVRVYIKLETAFAAELVCTCGGSFFK